MLDVIREHWEKILNSLGVLIAVAIVLYVPQLREPALEILTGFWLRLQVAWAFVQSWTMTEWLLLAILFAILSTGRR